jgi:E3 ubiquitin-protein ligase TRIP12
MDSSSHPQDQATSSTSESHVPQTEVRSSARVKAAKQKAKDKDDDRTKNKRTAKPKTKESKESTDTRPAKRYVVLVVVYLSSNLLCSARRAQPALTINEPVRDPKGKKRAAPEPSSDDEQSAGPSTKRARTTSYSLRSSTLKGADTPDMPRKTRSAICHCSRSQTLTNPQLQIRARKGQDGCERKGHGCRRLLQT